MPFDRTRYRYSVGAQEGIGTKAPEGVGVHAPEGIGAKGIPNFVGVDDFIFIDGIAFLILADIDRIVPINCVVARADAVDGIDARLEDGVGVVFYVLACRCGKLFMAGAGAEERQKEYADDKEDDC